LRWGILGTAQIAKEIIRAIRVSAASEVRAVASRNPSRAREWSRRHGIPLAFGSYGDLLQSGEVDLIYNPLPNSLHAEWTVRALEAGLPVLCEKPLAANAREAREVEQAAVRAGLHVAEGFMYRYHPQWDRVFELLRNGAVGSVTSLYSTFTFMLDDRSTIPASAELAGGALMDVGCYCVNFSRRVAGAEPSHVSAIERRTTVDDTLVGILDFPNGILASFETSIASFERQGAEIIGTEGSIVVEKPWLPGESAARITRYRPEAQPEEILIPAAHTYHLEVEEFVAVCSGQAQPRWPLSDAVANMAAIDALYLSAREARVVRP
jgi:xylose dehydrogenase (NAD/NADP)